MKLNKPAAVILAGGRSIRMGVRRKALLELEGRSLLAHVIGRLQTQANPLLLSCEGDTTDFDRFGLPVVHDLLPHHNGPLTGLCSALQYLADTEQEKGLVLCPCDAPFVPDTLVPSLLDAAITGSKGLDKSGCSSGPVVVSYQGMLQPTFSYWQNHHLSLIRDAVLNRGMRGLKQMLGSLPHSIVEWPATEPSPFFNINTPEDLEAAAAWLDRSQR